MVEVRYDAASLTDEVQRDYVRDRLREWAAIPWPGIVRIANVRIDGTDLVFDAEDGLAIDAAPSIARRRAIVDTVLVLLLRTGVDHGGISADAIRWRGAEPVLVPPDLGALKRSWSGAARASDVEALALAFPELGATFAGATTARAALDAFRAALFVADPVEARFLDELRAAPGDAATRGVYADWLDEHGSERRAAFLRLDDPDPAAAKALADPHDPAWRAVVARAPIAMCQTGGCPTRWDALAATADDTQRTCGTCTRTVHYVATYEQARSCGTRGDVIAVDASYDLQDAIREHSPPLPTMNPPAPRGHVDIVIPPLDPPATPTTVTPGFIDRVRGWFRR